MSCDLHVDCLFDVEASRDPRGDWAAKCPLCPQIITSATSFGIDQKLCEHMNAWHPQNRGRDL